MRKDYTPASALNPTFVGPYRIIEIQPQGAVIKDPRTGDIMSVHFQNLRKLTTDEFITLLPTNFDSDLLKTLGFYRYNKLGLPDKIGYTLPLNKIEDPVEHEEFKNAETPIPEKTQAQEDNFPPHLTRVLRSGKKIRVNTSTLPHPYVESAQYADWSKLPSMVKNEKRIMKPAHPCRISSLNYTYTPYVDFEQQTQKADDGYIFLFQTTLDDRAYRLQPERNYKQRYKSRFSSTKKGILTIKLEPDENANHSKVRFDKLEIFFY
jgi:hypothetical protein